MRAALLFLLLALPATAQEVPLMLRLQVSPQGPVGIGQRVTVTLTAMTPTRFAAPPTFPDLAPQGRAIVLPEGGTVPGTEHVGGQPYAALQHSYELFPAEAGPLVLPPLRMSAHVGDGTEASAEAASVSIVARGPPGARDLSRLVVAPEFRLTATTDRPPDGLHVGEAITRRLRLEASDTSSMLLPVALWGRPEGVAVYPNPPELRDQTSRGDLRATREESAAYVPQRPGPVELPGFSVSWFEPRSGRMQVVNVDPIRFEALPAVEAPPPKRNRLPWLAGGALVLVLAAAAGWLALRHRPRPSPEGEAFRALRRACRAGQPAVAFAALCRWYDTLPAPSRTEVAGVAALRDEARRLEDVLYARPPASAWSGSGLLHAARTARRHRRRLTRRAHPSPLPELNPRMASTPR
jgi:hypothetical protein